MPSPVELILAEIAAVESRRSSLQLEIARSAGLGRAASRLLQVIGDGATVPKLARRLSLTRQSVQRVADALVESRLAGYAPNPDHRRSPLLRLTSAGSDVRKSVERLTGAAAPDLTDDVDDEDLDTTLHVLRALRAVL